MLQNVILAIITWRWQIGIVLFAIGSIATSMVMDGFNPISGIHSYLFSTFDCEYQQEYCEKSQLYFRIQIYIVTYIFILTPAFTILLFRKIATAITTMAIVAINIPAMVLFAEDLYEVSTTIFQYASKFGLIAIFDHSAPVDIGFSFMIGEFFLLLPFLLWIGARPRHR